VILVAELADFDLQPIGSPMLAAEFHQIRTPLAGCAAKKCCPTGVRANARQRGGLARLLYDQECRSVKRRPGCLGLI
jgi:hypothetical protein